MTKSLPFRPVASKSKAGAPEASVVLSNKMPLILDGDQRVSYWSPHVSIPDLTIPEDPEADVACPFDEPPLWTQIERGNVVSEESEALVLAYRDEVEMEMPNPRPIADNGQAGKEQTLTTQAGNDASDQQHTEEAAELINIMFRDRGNELWLSMKITTKLDKAMSRFCKIFQFTAESFFFDGQRIESLATPKDLDMIDGDTVDVYGHFNHAGTGLGWIDRGGS